MSAIDSLANLGILPRVHGRVEQRLPCPRCAKSDRDDTLGCNIETGIYHCFRCSWSGRAGNGERDDGAHPAPIAHLDDPQRAERIRERLRRIWRETWPLNSPEAAPVRRYFEVRNLAPIYGELPPALRAHRGLDYYDDGRVVGRYPALIAMFTAADGNPATLHATFICQDGNGKASVRAPKKILGVPERGITRGGAIRLYEPRDGVLGVAEGLENALSLRLLLPEMPAVWTAYCSGNLARIALPRGLRTLYIAVDCDPAGERAARVLAQRVRRMPDPPRVVFARPDGEGLKDLNDELRVRGRH